MWNKISGTKLNLAAYISVIISGLLAAYACTNINTYLGLACLIPLIAAIKNKTPKASFILGLTYGATVSVCVFNWMLSASVKFTGGNSWYGIIGIIISTIIFSAFYAFATWLYAVFSKHNKAGFNAILFSLLWLLAENARYYLFAGFPFFALHTGYCLLNNLYAIQHIAYAGHGILTFLVVLMNYLLYHSWRTRSIKMFLFTACIYGVFLLSGYLLLLQFKSGLNVQNKVVLALADYNLPPEIKWDKKTGDSLAHLYKNLNQNAINNKPALIIWPESVIPWPYLPSDDLIPLLLQPAKDAGIYELIGLNMPVEGDTAAIHNAAVLFSPDGNMQVYYKLRLLKLLETPLDWMPGYKLPFVGGDTRIEPGNEKNLLNTPFGNIGVLICNEAVHPAYEQADANFFVNMSNDEWFAETYLANQHFYANVARAVETRKDVAIVSNCGYSGMINAGGQIMVKEKNKTANVNIVSVRPNSIETIAVKFPDWFLWAGLLTIIIFIALYYKNDKSLA